MAPNPNTGSDSVTGWGFYSDCVWAEDGVCARALDFPADIKIQLTARVSNQITGWLKGRINAPEASIEKFSARNIRISLAAQPAIVPRFSVFFDEKTLAPSDLNLILNSDRTGNGDRLLRNMPPDRRGQDGKFMAFRWLEAFRSYAKDTAAAESSLWNFSTIDPGSGSECLAKADGMVGVVTTNATVYSGVAPSYADGMLSYSVAGMHYAPDGKRLNLGTYDLVMRSDVARCLYKFTNAPISATISVISDNGEEKAATTIVNEKDGWLYLRAAGFTFSAPRIQVKLTQAVAPAPSPSSSPSATPSASPEPAVSSTTTPSTEATTKPISKKITITCVKGKIIKKVTAVSPKCPAGYKKK
jgi:hypothetical protein